MDFLDCVFDDMKITFCGLDTVSFQLSHFTKLAASDLKLAVTFCLDTIFEDGSFGGVLEHDFAQMQEPFELCLFQNCTSDWDLVVKDFKTWNGVDEDPLSFYYRVLNHITDRVHIGNLSPVQFLVKRVLALSHDRTQLADSLRRMFNVYFAFIREEQDISGFGTLATLMGQLPQELITNKSQYLPAPKILESQNVIRIEIACQMDSFTALHDVAKRLESLDTSLVECGLDHLKIEEFKSGSIILVVSSSAAAILGVIVLLYKVGHLFLDTENKILTNKKLSKDLDKAEKEASLVQYEEEIKKQQIILNDLEIQRRKNELRKNELPDKYISVTQEEVIELVDEDPFDRLELKPYNQAKKAAEQVLDLGETNVYIEVLESATKLS